MNRSHIASHTMIGVMTVAALFAGCLASAKSTEYHAFASKGSLAVGFAYDGKEVVPFDGSAFIDVNDAANTGLVVAKGKVNGNTWSIEMDEFMPSKPFHDGGIAANLREHGNSGVGDKSIPVVDLEMAGWGLAHLTIGGKSVTDPVTGADHWAAHFMVIRNGVRDNATGAIYADVNKTKVYDPAHPENGTSVAGDYELHLVLKNQTGNKSAQPIPIQKVSSTTPAPTLTGTSKLFTAAQVGGTANVYLNVTGTGLAASNVTFTFKSPSGSTLVARSLGAGMTPSQTTRFSAQVKFPVTELGDYTVQLSGRVAPGGGYDIGGLVQPPKTTVLYFWWEDLVFGADAEEQAHAAGLVDMGHETMASHPMSPSMSATATRAAP